MASLSLRYTSIAQYTPRVLWSGKLASYMASCVTDAMCHISTNTRLIHGVVCYMAIPTGSMHGIMYYMAIHTSLQHLLWLLGVPLIACACCCRHVVIHSIMHTCLSRWPGVRRPGSFWVRLGVHTAGQDARQQHNRIFGRTNCITTAIETQHVALLVTY